MGDEVSVTTEIHAPADRVWALVADLVRMKEWSPENDGVVWCKGATSAVRGARFTGTNRRESKRWSTVGTVLEAEPGRVLSFRITAVGQKVSVWRYRFEPTDAGCRVTETWIDERNALVKALGTRVSGVSDRATHNRAGMEQTLANLKAAAEA
ncbi:MAG: SRPBCC family protein [Acidimicrobiales bacterium]|jgi:uncharacterized protein YndB with AHSA1/START domain